MKKLLAPAVLLVANFLLKMPLTAQGFFAFTYDQGRDLLAVSRMIYEGQPTLIGPTTGLQGIFYGPTWYYFLAPLLYLSGGNPQGVANFIALFSTITILFIYILIKHLTKNALLAFCLAFIASIPSSWMFAPTLIWSPTIVPFLMILLFFCVHKIFTNAKRKYFFALGFLTILIGDGGAAFGDAMAIALVITPFVFKKHFFKKDYLFAILGAFLAASPRIVFDLKHNFLITKSVFAYINQPKVFGEHQTIFNRFFQRLDLFIEIFSNSFTKNNKILGLALLVILIVVSLKINKDKLFQYCIFLVITLFIFFTIFPDIVWDYYLIGLPLILLISISRIFIFLFKVKGFKKYAYALLFFLTIINIDKTLLKPFEISWLGDGATYRNQKMIMDYIAGQNPHNYSFYAYTPAIFDFPFDYLVYWYSKQGKIEPPGSEQDLKYLVIRDYKSKKYLSSGWYGDKTRDKTTILDKKEFSGDMVVEKHITK